MGGREGEDSSRGGEDDEALVEAFGDEGEPVPGGDCLDSALEEVLEAPVVRPRLRRGVSVQEARHKGKGPWVAPRRRRAAGP